MIYRKSKLDKTVEKFFEPSEKQMSDYTKDPEAHISKTVEREERLLSDPIIKDLIREIPRTPENQLKLNIIIQIMDSAVFQPMTSTEIADIVGKTPSTVRHAKKRAQQKIELFAQEYLEDPEEDELWQN